MSIDRLRFSTLRAAILSHGQSVVVPKRAAISSFRTQYSSAVYARASSSVQRELFHAVLRIHEVLPDLIQEIIYPTYQIFVPQFRAGVMTRPFSIYEPRKPRILPSYQRDVIGPDQQTIHKPLEISSMISLRNLTGTIIEGAAADPRRQSKMASRLALAKDERLLPEGFDPSTLCGNSAFLRESLGRSDLDVFYENIPGETPAARPKGFVMEIHFPNEREKNHEASNLPPIFSTTFACSQLLERIKKMNLIPPGMEIAIEANPQSFQLTAIGLRKRVDWPEIQPYVSNTLIEVGLRLRPILVDVVNQFRPGVYVPRLLVGDLHRLPFDLIQLGHRTKREESLRSASNQDVEVLMLNLENLFVRKEASNAPFWVQGCFPLQEGPYCDGQSFDEKGFLINPSQIGSGGLLKIAQNIQRLPQFADAEIIFSRFSEADSEGKKMLRLEGHFIYGSTRKIVEGERARPLTRAEASKVILEMRRKAPLPPGYAYTIEPELPFSKSELEAADQLISGIGIIAVV